MFDLTQTLTPDIPRFPGDPEVRVEPLPGMEPWQVSRLTMGTHSGTHMDAQKHRIGGGAGIDQYGPERLLGAGLVITATGLPSNAAIPAAVLDSVSSRAWPGWFAVVRTGWDQYWGDPRYFNHPWLSSELAAALVQLEVGLVAIDALSVDSTADAGSHAHEILLGANVLIVENLRGLAALDAASAYMFAFLPLALGDADAAPARAIAWHAAELAAP